MMLTKQVKSVLNKHKKGVNTKIQEPLPHFPFPSQTKPGGIEKRAGVICTKYNLRKGILDI